MNPIVSSANPADTYIPHNASVLNFLPLLPPSNPGFLCKGHHSSDSRIRLYPFPGFLCDNIHKEINNALFSPKTPPQDGHRSFAELIRVPHASQLKVKPL